MRQLPSNLPPGWQIEPQEDGSVRVFQTVEAHAQSRKVLIPIACVWNGALLAIVANAYGYTPSSWHFEGPGPGVGLLTLVPFAIIGFPLGQGALWGRYGREVWRASHNLLEYRWGWQFLYPHKSRRYTNGAWELREGRDEGNQTYWDLCFTAHPIGGLVLSTNSIPSCSLEQLHEIAQVLSKQTGWPLKLPPCLEPENLD